MCWASNPPLNKSLTTGMPTSSDRPEALGTGLRAEAALPCVKSRDDSWKEVFAPVESSVNVKQELTEADQCVEGRTVEQEMRENGSTSNEVSWLVQHQGA